MNEFQKMREELTKATGRSVTGVQTDAILAILRLLENQEQRLTRIEEEKR